MARIDRLCKLLKDMLDGITSQLSMITNDASSMALAIVQINQASQDISKEWGGTEVKKVYDGYYDDWAEDHPDIYKNPYKKK